MDALEPQKKLSERLGDDESRELIRFIESRPELATKQDLENLKKEVEVLFHKEVSGLAWKVAGFLVAQAAVITTLIKLIEF